MNKKKVVFSSIAFAVTAMAEYVYRALLRRNDMEVLHISPFHSNNMPWGVVSVVPEKYIWKPDVCLPSLPIGSVMPIQMIESQLPKGFVPDLWINIDSGFHWTGKPSSGKSIAWYSDPHVLRSWYNQVKTQYDYRFNPQSEYMESDEIYLPYACDKEWHNKMDIKWEDKEYDVCLIGNHYGNRVDLINKLRNIGYSCFFELGVAKEDAREIINKSKISINWSSMQDQTARVFEVMGCGTILLANRIKDLSNTFKENEEYYGFSNTEDAINKVAYILNNPIEGQRVAKNGYDAIINREHYWDNRVDKIMEVVYG